MNIIRVAFANQEMTAIKVIATDAPITICPWPGGSELHLHVREWVQEGGMIDPYVGGSFLSKKERGVWLCLKCLAENSREQEDCCYCQRPRSFDPNEETKELPAIKIDPKKSS